MTVAEVRERLRSNARAISGEVLRDMTAFRLNMLFRPQDFSLGKFFEKTAVLDLAHARLPDKLAAFDRKLLDTVEQVRRATDAAASGAGALIDGYKEEVERAVKDDRWQIVFPGKTLLAEFAQGLGLKSDVGFVNALIKEMAAAEEFIDAELLLLRETVLAGGEFTSPSVTVNTP